MSRFQHLQKLCLDGVGARLTDDSLLTLARKLPSLIDLNLKGCSQVRMAVTRIMRLHVSC